MKILFQLFFLCLVTGCATPSKPLTKADTLLPGYGVIVFSTIDDGSTTIFMSTGARAFVAIFTAGLTEVTDDRDLQLHFSKAGSDPSFYVFHPYISKERASVKKWHVLKLKEGDYSLKKLEFLTGNVHRTTNMGSGYTFTVTPGESLYLGDLTLSLKDATMTNQYGGEVSAFTGFITGVSCNLEEASRVVMEYPKYPPNLKPAKNAKCSL